MSMLKKFNSMFSSDEDELLDEQIEQRDNEQRISKERENKIVSTKKQNVNLATAITRKGDVRLVEPLVFADSKDIIDDIKAGKVVILNLTKLDLKTSDRLLDFVSGGLYAIEAKLKTIGDEIYLCVPKGVEVAGDFSEGEY